MLCFLIFATAAAAPVPRDFPLAASYTAHLVTNARSALCANCTFDGTHHINADPAKQYGLVQWVYGATNDTARRSYVNFATVFLGAKQQMLMVQQGGKGSTAASSAASCTLIAPYPAPIFNASWSAGAAFVGVEWFQQRLCRHWTGVYPFFIQGEVYASDYFEDLVTGQPVGFVNEVETFWYGADFRAEAVPDTLFEGVASMGCAAPELGATAPSMRTLPL